MGNTTRAEAKRKRQLTAQLIIGLLGEKKRMGSKDKPGLLKRCLDHLENELNYGDDEAKNKAMDKIIKLLPFVVAKEKAPAVQLNIQNNKLEAGGGTAAALQTAQDYFRERERRMLDRSKTSPIQDAQVVETRDLLPPRNYRKPLPGKDLNVEYEEEDD